MPITFSFCHEDGYVTVVYAGRFNDTELLDAWKNLYERSDWTPGLNELIDCSQVDDTDVTSDGLQTLAEYTKSIFSKHGIRSVKVAVYAPKGFSFGMSRIYEALSDDLLETVRVFDNLQEAKSWVKGIKEKH